LFVVGFTVLITEWRTKYQRQMNLADNKAKGKSVDSLLNFETVKYYGAENYEVQMYKDAILDYQVRCLFLVSFALCRVYFYASDLPSLFGRINNGRVRSR
jgi:ABC-type transport system involved in Fe-S cluster assembly fused permease/ATPase subunit